MNWVVSLLRADSDDVNRLRKAIRKTLRNIPDQVLDSLTTDHPDPRLIPGLIGLLTVKRKKIDESAATVLAAIGPPAVESLIGVLQSGPLDAQRWSVSILGQIGPAAAPAAEPLVQQLCSNRPWRAKEAQKQIGPSCQRFVIQGLVNGSSPVKNLCLEILESYGAAAADSVPELVELLDANDNTCGSCLQTVASIGPSAHAALPSIERLLQANRWTFELDKEMAFRALTQVGEAAIPYLIRLLSHQDLALKKRSTQLLSDIGLGAPKQVVPALAALLNDPTLGAIAARCLYDHGPQTRPIVTALTKHRDNPDESISFYCSELLATHRNTGENARHSTMVRPVFEGGGAFPVQYETDYDGHTYYVRCRWGWVTIEMDDKFEVFSQRVDQDELLGQWNSHETEVYLRLIADAILTGQLFRCCLHLPTVQEIGSRNEDDK